LNYPAKNFQSSQRKAFLACGSIELRVALVLLLSKVKQYGDKRKLELDEMWEVYHFKIKMETMIPGNKKFLRL
jgi:hypothetical protein